MTLQSRSARTLLGLAMTIAATTVPLFTAAPASASGFTGSTALGLGLYESCARMSNGTARCWGANDNGQVGDGTTTNRPRPAVVRNGPGTGPLTGVAQVASGGNFSCARMNDGTARCWGNNDDGQLGIGTSTGPNTCNSFFACSRLPVAVKNVAGNSLLRDVVSISVGFSHACARIRDGSVRCWGLAYNGQLGIGLHAPQSCPASGAPCSTLPAVVLNVAGTGRLYSVAQISAGWNHTCARITDGTVRCWGDDTDGELGDGLSGGIQPLPVAVTNVPGTGRLAQVAQIVGGETHTCARMNDGTARCWGVNSTGQLGDGTTSRRLRPVVVRAVSGSGNLTHVAQLVAGAEHTCARLTDGTARCWGHNADGQLGDGTLSRRLRPVPVKTGAGTGQLPHIVEIAAGSSHTCARIADGSARCWGHNAYYEVGDGTKTLRRLPVVVQ